MQQILTVNNTLIIIVHFVTILFLTKPVNELIIQATKNYRPITEPKELKAKHQAINDLSPDDEKRLSDDSEVPGAGAFIGNLERILIYIFLFMQLYAMIGFILTIKGFARYNDIAKKPRFAEYFSIGSLISILCTVIGYLISNQIITIITNR